MTERRSQRPQQNHQRESWIEKYEGPFSRSDSDLCLKKTTLATSLRLGKDRGAASKSRSRKLWNGLWQPQERGDIAAGLGPAASCGSGEVQAQLAGVTWVVQTSPVTVSHLHLHPPSA